MLPSTFAYISDAEDPMKPDNVTSVPPPLLPALRSMLKIPEEQRHTDLSMNHFMYYLCANLINLRNKPLVYPSLFSLCLSISLLFSPDPLSNIFFFVVSSCVQFIHAIHTNVSQWYLTCLLFTSDLGI